MRTGLCGSLLGLRGGISFGIFLDRRFSFIVGLIKTRPFKNNPASGPDETLQLGVMAFRTLLKTIFVHGLNYFKVMAAMGALVLVRWHIVLLAPIFYQSSVPHINRLMREAGDLVIVRDNDQSLFIFCV